MIAHIRLLYSTKKAALILSMHSKLNGHYSISSIDVIMDYYINYENTFSTNQSFSVCEIKKIFSRNIFEPSRNHQVQVNKFPPFLPSKFVPIIRLTFNQVSFTLM